LIDALSTDFLAKVPAGFLMQNVALAAPLARGGGAKIGYDLLLYRASKSLNRRRSASSCARQRLLREEDQIDYWSQ
jgi:hypothetical protein